MKKLLYVLSALFMIASCGPDAPNGSETVKLSVDAQSLEFSADGGEKTFTVTSSGLLRVVSGDN
ncbi:MAG: BACON domain-containing protein, partial [Bacteroidales bacterium]|nr:BACON domain-containing protein [Bacteroidales bacterium]